MASTSVIFKIRQDDELPILQAQIKDASGSAFDLTGATAVSLNYRLASGGSVTTVSGTITDAVNGEVEYQWAIGDTASAGVYSATWTFTYSASRTLTAPTQGSFTFVITEPL